MPMNPEQLYDRIYRYCYFRVRERETAEDLTQETFLRFLEHGYAKRGKTMNCLYTIARNLCVDEYRRRKPETLPEEFSAGPAGGADEETMTLRISVRMALAELDSEERELLLLRYANEEPLSVIADLLGVSRFTVRRRLIAAEKKLESKLGKEAW